MPFVRCGSAPSVIGNSFTVTYTMTATGQTFTYSEANATAADPYIDPTGAFIQDHRIITGAVDGNITIHFCRDRGGVQRPEVWFYYGRPLFKVRSTGTPWL